jgi:signal transduction histidine kinase
MTLRSRLTLWYVTIMAVGLLLYGVAVYSVLVYSLTQQIDETLAQTAEDIRRTFRRDVRGVSFSPLALDLTASIYAQVWDADGSLVARNAPLLDDPLDPEGLAAVTADFSTVRWGGTPLRVLSYPLVTTPEGDLVGHLQLAASLSTVESARELMLSVLLVGGVLAVGFAGVIGWSTAAAALRPLDEVTIAALQITRADDLSRRIPLRGLPRDEVGRLIAAFNETLERLENVFEAQRRFMADVSHELRTPLTVIRGNLDLVRRTGEVDRESIEAVVSEVDRMTRLVQDILVLSQAESGKLPLAREIVELDTLLLEVFQQARLLAQGRQEVRLGGEDQARVWGDRDRLKQVLLNLAANALEHTPSGGSVTMSLARVGEWARVTIRDTGVGIPKEDLPHIFERFYRVDKARRRSAGGGAGLGLSIAYWIARMHGGRIEVASEEAQGSTFSVWLPQAEET